MKTLNLTIVFGVLASVTGAAFAQAPNQNNGVAVAQPIYNWSYQRHASTATEGYLNGQSNVIRAQGQASYLNSLAAVNFEEARRRYIENSRLYVSTVIENRERNKQFRDKYKRLPPSKERLAKLNAMMLPERLSTSQINDSTGGLVWPHVLRLDEYQAYRERLDTLFANRTPENSGDGSPFQREVDVLIQDFKALLKANLKSLSTNQYTTAKAFLQTLDYEATFPMVSVQPTAQPAVDTEAQPKPEKKEESKA